MSKVAWFVFLFFGGMIIGRELTLDEKHEPILPIKNLASVFVCDTKYGSHTFVVKDGKILEHLIKEPGYRDRLSRDPNHIKRNWTYLADSEFKHRLFKDSLKCNLTQQKEIK